MIRKSEELAFVTRIFPHIKYARLVLELKELNCRLQVPYVQDKIDRPIRAQESDSHGSKGPLSDSTDLDKVHVTWIRHEETRGDASDEAEVGWSHWAVGRLAHGPHRLKLRHGTCSLAPKGGYGRLCCSSAMHTPMAPSYKYEKGERYETRLKWKLKLILLF